MNNALVKSKPLEELFLQAEKKRNELMQAAEEKARRENEAMRKNTLQAWAEKHLLTKEKLNDDQIQALFPYVRKWCARRLMKGLAGLGAWILFNTAVIGFLIGIPVYVPNPGGLTICFLFFDLTVTVISCIINLLAMCGDDNFFRDIFESFILRPARFIMHGHYRKLAKPEKIPSLAIG